MVFFSDRVELCGVDICSGPRSTTKRRILDCLRKKRSNGNFISYSSKELAKVAELKGGQNAAAGLIRDLRDNIVESLRSLANLECGRFEVIRSRGPGYRFADCLNVQDGDDSESTEIRDIDDSSDVPNDEVLDVPKGAARTRRAWILQQLAEGHELQAPALAKQFKCSKKTAERDLQALKKEGLIEFVGAPRTGYYRLRKPPESDL